MAPFNPNIQPTPGPGVKNIGAIDVPQNIRPQGVQNNEILPQGVQQGDMSAAYAGKAAAAGVEAEAVGDNKYADLFKDLAETGNFLGKAGVNIVKKDIEDKVYLVADKERQSYTDLLEKIKAGVGVKNVLDANAEDTGQESQPAEVANLPDTLSALQGARDSGKISGTYYQSRLLADAKNLRAQYPDFREEIDRAFAKVTGTNPANAYITSLVQDINRATQASASDKNKMLTYIRGNLQFPGAPDVYAKYNAGLMDNNDVIKWAAPYEQEKYQLNMRALKFQDQNNTRQDQQRIAGDNIDYASGVSVGRAVDSMMHSMGLNTSDDVGRLSSMEDNKLIPPTQWSQWGQQLATAKLQLRNRMISDIDAQGYTKAVGGKAEAIKRVDASLAPVDALIDRVYNHDFGGIYSIKTQLAAMNDQQQQKMLTDPKIGPALQTAKALKDIGGEQNLQNFMLDTIKGDFPQNFKAWYQASSQEMQTQYTMKNTGVPYTFNDRIDALKTSGINNAQLNRSVLDEVSKIADPKIPEAVRMNYALGAFSDGNRGMISRLQADGVDANGRQVSGQNAVFQRFTSPEMTHAMFELGKKEPQVWTNYVNWAKDTIGSELMNREINDLKALPDNAGVRVDWDPSNHRFVTVDTSTPESRAVMTHMRGNPTAPGANSYYNTVNATVNRMNSQIYNFKRIAEASGDNVDAFILKTIADVAGPDALQNVQGIPYNLIKQIGLARMRTPNNGG